MPGFVPYQPGAPAEHYISLSGGINPERNNGGALTVFTPSGKANSKNDPIQPGDSIFVKNNSFGYRVERTVTIWIPVLTLAVTIATFGITAGLIDTSN
jgi:hypothetical protein